jgi:hypothetical protein
VLILDQFALPEDTGKGGSTYTQLNDDVATHIRRAAATNLGAEGDPRLIPALSAVAPNQRLFDPKRPERPPRFWYQLPALADRHRPALFVARVNYGHPRTIANPGRVVVDANFSSLWPTAKAQAGANALLALLNSSWCIAAMEVGCTVMGGGALKVEAAHLHRLPIPAVSIDEWAELEALGCDLTEGGHDDPSEILDLIDEIVVKALVGARQSSKARHQTRQLAAGRKTLRSPAHGS